MSIRPKSPRCLSSGSIVIALATCSLAGGCSRNDSGASIKLDNKESEITPLEHGMGVRLPADKEAKKDPIYGLTVNSTKASQGFTLLAPIRSRDTFLIDMEGRVVHQWKGNCLPALSATLLENGHLLRSGALEKRSTSFFAPGGGGGRIQEFSWDGDLIWDFKFFDDNHLPNHDITKLPNGNVLVLAWECKSSEDAIAAGRQEAKPVLPDYLLEIKPTGKTSGEIVWEWHIWDHLVQDHDQSMANYGVISEHPELIDVNYGAGLMAPKTLTPAEMKKLHDVGYLGAPAIKFIGIAMTPDWPHVNSIAYNAELDQIMLSALTFSEIWIIDHGTTKFEAAGHSGGRHGKGGDLLYRWGNPRAYKSGTTADQRLFSQHDAHWIPKGLPGEGHVLVFNNGRRRSTGSYSSVDELVPPVTGKGDYHTRQGSVFGPDQLVWTYAAPKKGEFFSNALSGAQRQPNGNTLICSGMTGELFEVSRENEVVWRYGTPDVGPTRFKNATSTLFRALRYSPDFPGLKGRDLKPGKKLEEQ
jgi:hypothetical protein